MKYDKAYFITKFEAIPDNQWTINYFDYKGAHCALGHCGNRDGKYTEEGAALWELFHTGMLRITAVNDGFDDRFVQPKPKQRVLAALRSLP